MKALLLKDVYVLYKQLRYLLVTLLLFCTLPTLSATAFSMIFVVMLPVTTLGYDERSKWEQLAMMMPYTTRQLVLSKYILGYLGAGVVTVISLLSDSVSCLLEGQPLTVDVLQTLVIFPCIGLLLFSLNLPLMFRYGTEKGRIGYIITVGILSAMAALIPQGESPLLDVLPLTAALVVLTILINLFSIKLSLQFFNARKA